MSSMAVATVGAISGGLGTYLGAKESADAQGEALDQQAQLAQQAAAYATPVIEANRTYGNSLIGDNLAYGQAQMLPYQTWGNQGMDALSGMGSYTDYMNNFNYNATPAAQYQNTQLMNSLAAMGLSGQGTAASKQAELAGMNYNTERDYYANNYLTDYNANAQQMGLGLDATNSLIGMQDNATQSLLGIGNQSTNALLNANGVTTDALSQIAGQQGAVDASFYAGLGQIIPNTLATGVNTYNALMPPPTTTTPAATNPSLYPSTTGAYSPGVPSYSSWGIA